MTTPSKTVTFTHDAAIVNEGRVPRLYRAGETHTLRIDQANRWIKRGMAVVADSVATARAEMEALRVKREAPALPIVLGAIKPEEDPPEPELATIEPKPEAPASPAEVMTPRKPPDAFKHDDIKPSQNQQRRNGNR